MVALVEGEEISYLTDEGEKREATITLIEALEMGCVGVTPDSGDQQIITADQISGVSLSDDGERWELDAYA